MGAGEAEEADELPPAAVTAMLRLYLRITSCSVAQTKKYCCLRRSSLPLYVESEG
jgi:hypothetical protein